MSLTFEQSEIMAALVESSDSRVSARDRIDAARVLAEAGAAAEPEGAAILIREVAALSDAALDHELDLFLRPDVERQVAAALRGLEAREAAVTAREAELDEREARFAAMGVEAAQRAVGGPPSGPD